MADFSELGYSGLSAWSGTVTEEFVSELNSLKKRYKAFNEMRSNSPIIGGLLYAIKQGIRSVDWQFTSNQEDDERVEFLEEARETMRYSWNDHITEALTMLVFGFAPFEIVYEYGKDNEEAERSRPGAIYWKKMALRGQDSIERWDLDDNGGINGIFQRAAPTYQLVRIPIEKMVLYRTDVEKNNPEGRSILRSAYIPYYFVKNIQTIEGIGIERDLAGLPWLRLPEGADTTDSTTSDFGIAKKTVRNIRRDEQAGLVTPFGWEFELVSTGGSRQVDTNAVIMRHESRILMSALAQFLILGQDKVGAQALSADFTDFFANSIDATTDIIAETFTKYAAKRLLRLNGMDTEGIRLEHSLAGDVNVNALADALQKTANLYTWMPEAENWLRSVIGLPQIDPDVLEQEREAEAERKAEMVQAMQQRGGGDEPEQNIAEVFATDMSNDEQRRYFERRYQRLWTDILQDQLNDVVKGARRMKRDGVAR